MVFFTDFDCIVENFFYLFIRSLILIVVVGPGFKYFIDSEGSYFDSFGYAAHAFVQILDTVVDLIFFTNFKALFDGKEEVFLKRLEEFLCSENRHEFNVS